MSSYYYCCCSYYSSDVIRVLSLTVILGSVRTLWIKSYFDLGYYDPFLTTILLLLANALSLPIYHLSEWYNNNNNKVKTCDDDASSTEEENYNIDNIEDGSGLSSSSRPSLVAPPPPLSPSSSSPQRKLSSSVFLSHSTRRLSTTSSSSLSLNDIALVSCSFNLSARFEDLLLVAVREEEKNNDNKEEELEKRKVSSAVQEDQQLACLRIIMGSQTGLDYIKAKNAAKWIHTIPFYIKPCITGWLGVLDVVFRVF